ncbi:hypothetical protein B5P43_09995 [Bacillus sp. SRB_336]|nr:hypothetical protein B5P43_09995 [Bacillus sp. SRB_336]
MQNDDRFKSIADELRKSGRAASLTPRQLVSWFGGARRGSWIVSRIREGLASAELTTEPDFESAYFDAPLEFRLVEPLAPVVVVCESASLETSAYVEVIREASAYADPTYRLSKLEAANRRPLSVSSNTSVSEAVTLMMSNDYSQLPVMNGERDVKGVVSWQSIGARLSFGKDAIEVRDVMDEYYEISSEASLFQAIPIIVMHQYVLVRGKDKSIVGIVTASDLSLQFQQLSEPFLLLGEVENHLRRILELRLPVADLAAARDPSDTSRSVERVSDLTFGEYLRLIENSQTWTKLHLPIDRTVFSRQLDRVRTIRNDVMHFDPDGIPDEDLDHLRKMVGFLQRLQELGVS